MVFSFGLYILLPMSTSVPWVFGYFVIIIIIIIVIIIVVVIFIIIINYFIICY